MTENPIVKQQLQELMDKLEKFYWSPNHPSSYVILVPANEQAVGVGRIAMQKPAAFNLMYAAIRGKLNSVEEQRQAVTLFVLYKTMLDDKESLEEIAANLTLFTKDEFTAWIQDEANTRTVKPYDLAAIRKSLDLPAFRGV